MEQIRPEDVLYEDNHLIVVNKHAGENVQGDSSGDFPLVEKVREYIRHKFEKPGKKNIYLNYFGRSRQNLKRTKGATQS